MSAEAIQSIRDKVNSSRTADRPLHEWHKILAPECGVYVYGEAYLGKRFDHIQYAFIGKDGAREILVDNLYALLRFKYFKLRTDDVDKRIKEIINSFTENLKTTLIRASFAWEQHSSHHVIKQIPNSSVAFRNGVFDFKKNDWLFMYDKIAMSENMNTMYDYDNQYVIMWYIDIDFTPLPLNIMETSLTDFMELMKMLTKAEETRNHAYELMHNMSFDATNNFSMKRFQHLSEVLGYSMLQQFTQHFVLLIGSGQNGKNSLFDGCLTPFLVPKPAANSLDALETDKFITGALENKYHNIFLETEAKTHTQSMMLKALTGSMYQSIESKGANKYSAILNVKYLFAGNDQDKIKFTDTTPGFRRRINVYEVWYRWDKYGNYLEKGDYYDVTFSGDLREFKANIINTITYIYFAMYGILSATNEFETDFAFTYNEWKTTLADVDNSMKAMLGNITIPELAAYIKRNKTTRAEGRSLLYTENGDRLYRSPIFYDIFKNSTYDSMLDALASPDFVRIVDDTNIFINIPTLRKIVGSTLTPTTFTQTVKKLYNIEDTKSFFGNQPYLECTINGNKLLPITFK